MDPNYSREKKERLLFTALFLLILFAGVFLRCYQYLQARSLWEDEAHIALNFIWRGYKDLMKPLDNFQTAPVLFLFSVETMTRIFGYGEKALRAVPFIIALLTLPFVYPGVRDMLKNKIAAIIVFLVFALNISLIYYSSEVKSYSIDVCVFTTVVFLLFSKSSIVNKHRYTLLAIVGALSVVLSNVSVIVLLCAGIYMLRLWKLTPRREDKSISVSAPLSHVAVFATWVVVFVVNFAKFIFKHPYGAGMKQIWQSRFCPTPIFGPEFNSFMQSRIDDSIFTELLFFTKGYYFPIVLTMLLVSGIIYIIVTKRYYIFLFTVFPILLHLVLSMLEVYPFFYRFILYLMPPFIILAAMGIAGIYQLLSKKLHFSAGIALILYCCYCMTITSVKNFPPHEREIKPVLNFINRYGQTKVYITTPATLYDYYRQMGYAKDTNTKQIQWSIGPEQYYEKVADTKTNYLLLYSVDGYADGYGNVLKDLVSKNLVVRRFEYKTYGVMELRPKQ